MAINFPDSPTNGQSYNDPGTGQTWTYELATNSWTASSLAVTGGVVYKGSVDITAAPPTGAKAGEQWSIGTGGTANAGYGPGITGTITKGGMVMYTGTDWLETNHSVPDATTAAKGIDTRKWDRTGTVLSPATAGDVVNISAATAALPGLTPVGDADTGLFFPGADQLAVATGGAQRITVDGTGKLLVGIPTARSNFFAATTYTPQLQLEGTNTAGQAMFSITSGDTTLGPYLNFARQKSGTIGGNTVVANQDNLGNLSFHGSDGTEFVEAARINAFVDGTPGVNAIPGALSFGTTPAGASSTTEYMRIDNLGTKYNYGTDNHVLFSNTSKGSNTSDSLFYGRYSATGPTNGTLAVVIRSNGQIENVNGVYATFSDLKLKENIADAQSQWDDIKKLKVVNYNYRPETNYDQHTQLGVIAQDLERICPGLVSESADRDKDGNDLGTVTKSVNYSVLYMKAIKALQEAITKIESLEARLTAASL